MAKRGEEETGMYVLLKKPTSKAHVYECLKKGIDIHSWGACTTANPFAMHIDCE